MTRRIISLTAIVAVAIVASGCSLTNPFADPGDTPAAGDTMLRDDAMEQGDVMMEDDKMVGGDAMVDDGDSMMMEEDKMEGDGMMEQEVDFSIDDEIDSLDQGYGQLGEDDFEDLPAEAENL